MSILIHHFVMHQLRANEKGAMSLVPNATCIAVNQATTSLAQEIQQVFASKPGKGIGSFMSSVPATDADDEVISSEDPMPFVDLLRNGMGTDDAFLLMSTQASQSLITTMAQDNIVETGFIVFSHYEFLATEYLFIGIINTKQHVEVSDDLELVYSDHLDIAKMQLAVRIDLTAWKVQPEQERYISFIKGRMGRKVSDFFMRFLQCEEKVDVKHQNQQLLKTVENYLAEESLSVDEKNTSLAEVQDYYKKQINNGANIKVSELAEVLPKTSRRKRSS